MLPDIGARFSTGIQILPNDQQIGRLHIEKHIGGEPYSCAPMGNAKVERL